MTEQLKRKIFISHASEDKELVQVLKNEIKTEFGFKDDSFFDTSDEYTIKPGNNWFEDIKNALDNAVILIPLITPCGAKNTWVAFEYGYFWARNGGTNIYTLFTSRAKVPSPLNNQMAKRIDEKRNLEAYFEQLRNKFDEPPTRKANIDAIIEKAWRAPLLSTEETKMQMEAKLFLRQAKDHHERQDIIEWMHSQNILQGADFRYLDLSGNGFIGTTLYKANFGGATLFKTSFFGSNLEEAVFGSTRLQGADFSKVTCLVNTSFEDAQVDSTTKSPYEKYYNSGKEFWGELLDREVKKDRGIRWMG